MRYVLRCGLRGNLRGGFRGIWNKARIGCISESGGSPIDQKSKKNIHEIEIKKLLNQERAYATLTFGQFDRGNSN